jgi:predicted nucleotidyltransferase
LQKAASWPDQPIEKGLRKKAVARSCPFDGTGLLWRLMLVENVRQAVAQYAVLLRAKLGSRVRAVRLFGSWARHQAGPRSDVDVFVLVDEHDERTRTMPYELCDDILFRLGVDISLTVVDERQWQYLLDRERRIASDITREGIAL